MALLSPFPGVPIIRFSRNYEKWCQLSPLILLLLQQVLEEVSRTGMLWPLLIIFFMQVPFLARLLILIKKGGLLQLKFGVVGVGVGVGVGVNIYLWAR